MPGDLAIVYETIDRHRDQSVDRLLAYLHHPGISAQNIGIQDVADRLTCMLAEMGLAASSMPTAGNPMVVGRWQRAAGKPTVLLYGHYEVQPPDPIAAWTTTPFRAGAALLYEIGQVG